MSMSVEVVWCVESLETLVRRWVEGYQPTDGRVIQTSDWWLDPVKGQVVIRLFLGEEPDAD